MRSALWPGPAPLDRRCRVPCAGWKATWSAVAGSTIWCGGLQGVSTSPPATATPPPAEPPPLARGNIYQKTKAEAEPLALAFHRQRGLPVAVVRPGAIYGPGETRLLKLFRAIARKRYAIVGSGRAFYHPVFIDDLVHGFLLALDRPPGGGGEAGCVPCGTEPPLHRRRVEFWVKSRAFSIEKARRLLGYAPRVDLD